MDFLTKGGHVKRALLQSIQEITNNYLKTFNSGQLAILRSKLVHLFPTNSSQVGRFRKDCNLDTDSNFRKPKIFRNTLLYATLSCRRMFASATCKMSITYVKIGMQCASNNLSITTSFDLPSIRRIEFKHLQNFLILSSMQQLKEIRDTPKYFHLLTHSSLPPLSCSESIFANFFPKYMHFDFFALRQISQSAQ